MYTKDLTDPLLTDEQLFQLVLADPLLTEVVFENTFTLIPENPFLKKIEERTIPASRSQELPPIPLEEPPTKPLLDIGSLPSWLEKMMEPPINLEEPPNEPLDKELVLLSWIKELTKPLKAPKELPNPLYDKLFRIKSYLYEVMDLFEIPLAFNQARLWYALEILAKIEYMVDQVRRDEQYNTKRDAMPKVV